MNKEEILEWRRHNERVWTQLSDRLWNFSVGGTFRSALECWYLITVDRWIIKSDFLQLPISIDNREITYKSLAEAQAAAETIWDERVKLWSKKVRWEKPRPPQLKVLK